MFRPLLLFLGVIMCVKVFSQRKYSSHSVLQKGTFIKIGVTESGVYKIDAKTLLQLGIINSGYIESASIRIYGNGGQMLFENNNGNYVDDLVENGIQVKDGGDGIFNNNDFFFFYAQGPHQWLQDSIHHTFNHIKNRYSDTSFYFITLGGMGLRIANGNSYNISNFS